MTVLLISVLPPVRFCTVVRRLLTLLEPALILGLGAIVGGIITAILTALLALNDIVSM